MQNFLLPLLFLLLPGLTHAVEIGQSIPDCQALSEVGSQSFNISAFRGKVVLVDFWATWCPPCAQSMPFLNNLRNELKDQGFEIVAINVDEDVEQTKRFLEVHRVDYPILMDPKGQCPAAFDVQAMPSSYFVDKTGKVRAVHQGYRDSDQAEIRRQVLQLLRE